MNFSFNSKFQAAIVDADSIVHRAAVILQENFVRITHKPSGKITEFPTKTEFWGRTKARDGGWLGEHNAKLLEKGKRILPPEDFEVEQCSRPKKDIENHVEFAVKYFKTFLKGIASQEIADRVIPIIGGTGNYRRDKAHTLEYKGNRGPKPIFYDEVKAAIREKFSNSSIVVDDIEAEDEVAKYALANIQHHRKTEEWLYILYYIDKDLDMLYSPSVNYDEDVPTIRYKTPFECAASYAKQLLIGDRSTDNIQGLLNLEPELREKYGVRKGKGLGEKAAEAFLESAISIPELFDRVCEAYRAHYGEGLVKFVSWRGEELSWTWKDFLQETAILVYISHLKDPASYDVFEHFKKLGVNIDG